MYRPGLSKSSSRFDSSLEFASIGKSTDQHPNIPASESMSSTYFHWERKISFFDLATSMLKKYRNCLKSFVWNFFCRYNFNSNFLSIITSNHYIIHINKQKYLLFLDGAKEWSFWEWRSPTSLTTEANLSNHVLGDYFNTCKDALGDCFNSYKDFLRWQTCQRPSWATKWGGCHINHFIKNTMKEDIFDIKLM